MTQDRFFGMMFFQNYPTNVYGTSAKCFVHHISTEETHSYTETLMLPILYSWTWPSVLLQAQLLTCCSWFKLLFCAERSEKFFETPPSVLVTQNSIHSKRYILNFQELQCQGNQVAEWLRCCEALFVLIRAIQWRLTSRRPRKAMWGNQKGSRLPRGLSPVLTAIIILKFNS